ncbi:MAG: hypothetical protein JW844_04880 [Candidatus Omnitrophica bacterium]|nr:hypothetical protein [Candidatus Omnitrophota bacterium]
MKKEVSLCRQLLCLIIALCIAIAITAELSESYAAPVGNSLEITTPRNSLISRSRSIALALALEETGGYVGRFKGALDLEFVLDKEFSTSTEVTDAKLDDGQWYMAKVSYAVNERIEPYLTFGVANLNYKWNNSGTPVEVDSDSSFAWGVGSKLELWKFKDYGMKLYADFQYRETEPDLDSIQISGTGETGTETEFKVREWQRSLLVSKELDRYVGGLGYRFIPYAGLTWSDTDINLHFVNNSAVYDLYHAGNKNKVGFVAGCDVLPEDAAAYAFNLETRFIDEFAITAGGVVRF